MKTTTVLSTLSVVGSAMALPAGLLPTRDTSDCGTTVSSNNNNEYIVSCSMDSYASAALRETDTAIGLAGCLTACDGTVDCASVTFYPSASGSDSGTCQLYSTGATRLITNPDTEIAVRVIPIATRSASNCDTAVSSNNNNQYFVECSMDSYASAAIRETDTEIGLAGCLTACDGTVNCSSVTFYPTASGSDNGTCQLYSTSATRLITNPDTEIAVRVTTPTTLDARADPTHIATRGAPTEISSREVAPDSPYFSAVAFRSGADFHFDAVNANSTHFWLGKATSTYTPEGIPASSQTATVFALGNDTLALHVAVPGGQQVYVNSEGLLSFTVAHSGDVGVGSKTTGFAITADGLGFEGSGFLACETEVGVYEIYASSVADKTDDAACSGFEFWTLAATGDAAWEYV